MLMISENLVDTSDLQESRWVLVAENLYYRELAEIFQDLSE